MILSVWCIVIYKGNYEWYNQSLVHFSVYVYYSIVLIGFVTENLMYAYFKGPVRDV